MNSDYTPTTTPFNEKFCLQIALTHDASPLDFFSLFFDDAILKMLIDGTNSYTSDVIAEKGEKWKANTKIKVEKLETSDIGGDISSVGCYYQYGSNPLPRARRILENILRKLYSLFPYVLSRNRFEEIFWMLHLPEVTTHTHRIDKVKTFLHTLVTTFQSVFYPGCEVSIDETMIGFKGRVSFLQYCPKKPTKWGLKAYH